MKADQLSVGQKCTYYPSAGAVDDNLHFPAIVEFIGKRVRVRIFMAGAEDVVIRNVSAKRLANQYDLLPDGDFRSIKKSEDL